MSRKGRFVKNNMINNNPPRHTPVSSRLGRNFAQPFDGDSASSGYSQHDTRYREPNNSRPPRGLYRGRASRGRGGPRQDYRNNARKNNHVLSNVRREDETFKVTIPLSDKYEPAYLMQLLKEAMSDLNVVFYNFQKIQNSHVFYVLGADNADTLRNMSRRVITSSGQRLVILTTRAPLPSANVDANVEALMKAAMSRLYDLTTNVMDLGEFRQAEEFKQHGIYLTIFKPNVLRKITEIIINFTPNLLALNLRNNGINFLDQLKPLADSCRSLKALDLSQNKIHTFNEIHNLAGLDLVELVLEGNPFIDDFTSHATYISAVRKMFKNLRKLDNEDLPDEIGFDLGVTENLPEAQGSYIPPEVNDFVHKFLEMYFNIYDSENRQELIAAYHDQATFSFSFAKHDNTTAYTVNDQMYGYRDSHNLFRIRDESLWVKYVKTTKLDIVSYLCKFPNTQHDPSSFKIDIPLVEASLVIIVVNGTFKETFKTNTPLRSFCRTFFIVPQGSGFVIVNEMLVISNPSAKQSISNSKQNRARQPTGGNQDRLMSDVEFTNNPSTSSASDSFGGPIAPSVQPQPSASVILSPPSSLLNPQEEIIKKFMEVTRMNREFSKKCLEEHNFNPEQAYAVFTELQARNAIPAEAFV